MSDSASNIAIKYILNRHRAHGVGIEVLAGLDMNERDGCDGQSTESKQGINREVVAHTCSRDYLPGSKSTK